MESNFCRGEEIEKEQEENIWRRKKYLLIDDGTGSGEGGTGL